MDLVGVQHHHAHIASCLADNGEDGPVIGVAFDGTGFGPDGTSGVVSSCSPTWPASSVLGHLGTVAMPGGAAAIRQPWRMAAAYLDRAWPGPAGRRALAARARSGRGPSLHGPARGDSPSRPAPAGCSTRSPGARGGARQLRGSGRDGTGAAGATVRDGLLPGP